MYIKTNIAIGPPTTLLYKTIGVKTLLPHAVSVLLQTVL